MINMKIIYYHKGFWPGESPGTSFITFNALGFQQNGADFLLITGRKITGSVSEILQQKFQISEPVNVKLISSPKKMGGHFIQKLKVLHYLWIREFDVLITRCLDFLSYALWLKRFKSFKLIYEAHDFLIDLKLRDDVRENQLLTQSRMEQKYLPLVDGVICVSRPQAELYQKYLPHQHILSATTGIKPKDHYCEKMTFNYKMGYFGSFNLLLFPLEVLIEALSHCKVREVKLLLIGGKSEEQLKNLRGIAEKFQLQNRVQVELWKTPTEISRLSQEIDVGLSIIKENFFANLISPMKVMEYISNGRPVISTELEATKDIITPGRHGFLTSNDPHKWAEAIDSLYGDFARYRELSRNCLELSQELSWKKRAQKILNFLNLHFPA
jgi:glycosyltransferase involved in cell wall biosynthesis